MRARLLYPRHFAPALLVLHGALYRKSGLISLAVFLVWLTLRHPAGLPNLQLRLARSERLCRPDFAVPDRTGRVVLVPDPELARRAGPVRGHRRRRPAGVSRFSGPLFRRFLLGADSSRHPESRHRGRLGWSLCRNYVHHHLCVQAVDVGCFDLEEEVVRPPSRMFNLLLCILPFLHCDVMVHIFPLD